jgi:hypothetical protein
MRYKATMQLQHILEQDYMKERLTESALDVYIQGVRRFDDFLEGEVDIEQLGNKNYFIWNKYYDYLYEHYKEATADEYIRRLEFAVTSFVYRDPSQRVIPYQPDPEKDTPQHTLTLHEHFAEDIALSLRLPLKTFTLRRSHKRSIQKKLHAWLETIETIHDIEIDIAPDQAEHKPNSDTPPKLTPALR